MDVGDMTDEVDCRMIDEPSIITDQQVVQPDMIAQQVVTEETESVMLKETNYQRFSRMFAESFPAKKQIQNYKMDSSPRGLALIINIIKYNDEEEFPYRSGADVDGRVTRDILEYLGYIVQYEEDLTYLELRSCLRTFSEDQSHAFYDSTIVFLMGHGNLNTIYCKDGCEMQEFEMFKYFNNYECKNLRDKPKMFFFQTCRGELDDGVPPSSDGRGLRTARVGPSADRIWKPTWADMFIAYSTVPNYKSARDPVHGSWYVQILCKILKECSSYMNLSDMMKLVTEHVRAVDPATFAQSCCTEERGVIKHIYFNKTDQHQLPTRLFSSCPM